MEARAFVALYGQPGGGQDVGDEVGARRHLPATCVEHRIDPEKGKNSDRWRSRHASGNIEPHGPGDRDRLADVQRGLDYRPSHCPENGGIGTGGSLGGAGA